MPAGAQGLPSPPPSLGGPPTSERTTPGGTRQSDQQAIMESSFNLGLNIGQKIAMEIAAMRARIIELEKICGEPCKKEK